MATFDDIYKETSTSATMTIGVVSKPGKLVLSSTYIEYDNAGIERAKSSWGSFSYDGTNANLKIGDVQMGKPGKIILGYAGTDKQCILLDAEKCKVTLGGYGNGMISMLDRKSNEVIKLDSENANLTLGGGDLDGDILLKNTKETTTITLSGNSGSLSLGGGDVDGDILMKNTKGTTTISLSGNSGSLSLGGGPIGSGANSVITMKDATGIIRGKVDGSNGNLLLNDDKGNTTVKLDGLNGNLSLGGVDHDGDLYLKNSDNTDTIIISGGTGYIEFKNADFAEDFSINELFMDQVTPGTVMKLDEKGTLIPCDTAYDSKVVGIIAGAGTFKSGIIMDKNGEKNRLPIAMMGKVFCFVDADIEPIKVGDMLTTSAEKGHAMKVMNRTGAFGTVIGKALANLDAGKGLIPVLVNLQ